MERGQLRKEVKKEKKGGEAQEGGAMAKKSGHDKSNDENDKRYGRPNSMDDCKMCCFN